MIQKINSLEEYHEQYAKSVSDPEAFWNEKAETFYWQKKWAKTLEWEFSSPNVKWFLGGKLNIAENCLDRHLEARGDKVAILWEPNDPKEEAVEITYTELHDRVCRFANVLKRNGAKKGDRICLYMPMTPELAVATLACARIGAIHSVVFAGFSAKSLEDRINDATCNIIVTADGAYRKGKPYMLKPVVDVALSEGCECVENVCIDTRQ